MKFVHPTPTRDCDPDNSLSLAEKHGLGFLVLSDQGVKVASELGLVPRRSFPACKSTADLDQGPGVR